MTAQRKILITDPDARKSGALGSLGHIEIEHLEIVTIDKADDFTTPGRCLGASARCNWISVCTRQVRRKSELSGKWTPVPIKAFETQNPVHRDYSMLIQKHRHLRTKMHLPKDFRARKEIFGERVMIRVVVNIPISPMLIVGVEASTLEEVECRYVTGKRVPNDRKGVRHSNIVRLVPKIKRDRLVAERKFYAAVEYARPGCFRHVNEDRPLPHIRAGTLEIIESIHQRSADGLLVSSKDTCGQRGNEPEGSAAERGHYGTEAEHLSPCDSFGKHYFPLTLAHTLKRCNRDYELIDARNALEKVFYNNMALTVKVHLEGVSLVEKSIMYKPCAGAFDKCRIARTGVRNHCSSARELRERYKLQSDPFLQATPRSRRYKRPRLSNPKQVLK